MRSTREVDVGGISIRYVWVQNSIRRHTHLVMDDVDGLQLRTPARVSAAEADRLVARARDWVEAARVRQAGAKAAKVPIVEGAQLPYLGSVLELRLRKSRSLRISRRGDQLMVSAPDLDPVRLHAELERWYRSEARSVLWERLIELGQPHGLLPTSVSIRAQRTRWGSCSRSGRINLNWRLMLLERDLTDYVLVHELCHLRHMNHGRDFWQLVGTLMPDFEQRESQVNAIRGAALAL